jgi:hypothetical protein
MAIAVAGEEKLDVAAIAWGQGKLGKFSWREPGEGGVFVTGWFAADRGWDEYYQERGIRVGDGEVGFSHGFDVDAEFLGQFAADGRFIGFVRFDFTAGEFPEACVALL